MKALKLLAVATIASLSTAHSGSVQAAPTNPIAAHCRFIAGKTVHMDDDCVVAIDREIKALALTNGVNQDALLSFESPAEGWILCWQYRGKEPQCFRRLKEVGNCFRLEIPGATWSEGVSVVELCLSDREKK